MARWVLAGSVVENVIEHFPGPFMCLAARRETNAPAVVMVVVTGEELSSRMMFYVIISKGSQG